MPSRRTLSLPLAGRRLVLGLQWQPVVGRNPDSQARRKSRLHQATHLILADDPVATFALAWMDGTSEKDGKPLYSAAYSFAQLFPDETVAVIKDLGEHGCWLVAAHEGSVIAGTDTIYESVGPARDELKILYQAYPQLHYLDNGAAPELALLAASADARHILHSASGWRRLWSAPIGILSILLLACSIWAWREYGSAPIGDNTMLPSVDPNSAWDSVIQAYERGRYLHGVGDTQAILRSLGDLPVRISGWALKTAECSPAERWWQCQADYERIQPVATYNGFLSAVSTSWSTSFPDLNRAQSRWQVKSGAVPLARRWLSDARQNERILLSELQRMQAAFSRMEIGPSVPASIVSPVDSAGLSIGKPDGYAGYAQRRVSISGPLRSVSILLPHVAVMSWRRLVLTLQEQDAPDLRRSRLFFTLEGTLYEIDYASSKAS